MIKTSSHTTKFANTGKEELLKEFLLQYQIAVQFYIDHLWGSLTNDLYVPRFISTKNLKPVDLDLSTRALRCASTQACGIVKSSTEKRRKQLHMLKKLMREGKDTSKLQRKIDKKPLTKPKVPYHVSAELNSICVDFS